MEDTHRQRWEQFAAQADAWRTARQADRLGDVGRELIALDPGHELGYRCLSDAAHMRGDLTGAIRHIHDALRRDPEFYWLHYRLAALRLANGQSPLAEQAVKEALRLAPEHVDSWNLLARIALEEDDLAGAENALERALRLDPNHVASLGVSADLVVQRDGPSRLEIKLCRQALEADPESDYAHHRLAFAYRRAGDLDQAEIHAREALRLDPTDACSQELLFDILRRRYRLYRWMKAPERGLAAAWGAVAKVPVWAWVVLAITRVPLVVVVALVLASLAWLLFLWPALTIYQAFVLADIRRQAGLVGEARSGPFRLARWSMPARMAMVVLLTAVVWLGVVLALRQEGVVRVLGWTVVGAILLGLLAGWYLLGRDALRRRRRRRDLEALEGAR